MKKFLLFTCIALSLFSCKEAETKEEKPTTVKTAKAIESPKESTRSYTFISRPYRVTELSFRVGGPVNHTKLYFHFASLQSYGAFIPCGRTGKNIRCTERTVLQKRRTDSLD